jgi:hypothetical protein
MVVYKPGSTSEIFGYVRYILPNSDATDKDIQRGTIFPELMEPNLPLAITRVY